MKNIYSFTILFLCVLSMAGQSRIFPPTLKAPANEAMSQAPNVLLNWFAVTGITTDISYQVQLATNIDFSDAVTFPNTDLTALEMSDLSFGSTYYWRVKAFDGDSPSDWSTIWKFQVIGSVVLKLPNNGEMVYSNPEITWNAITGLKSYQMQVDTSYEWKAMNSGTTNDIKSTFILNENDMWAAGEAGLILHFDGTTWTQMDGGTTETLNSIYFVSQNDGYAVGNVGTIIHYDGTLWTAQDAGVSADLKGIAFADAIIGWAVGTGGLVLKYNAGVWTQEATGNTIDLNGLSVVSSTDVWACGKTKVITHFDGNVWTTQEVGTKELTSIYFTSPTSGWVVGKTGTIFMYNGSEWVAQTSGTTKDFNSISFDGNTGYAVGKTGTLVIYDGLWSVGNGVVNEDLNAICVFNGLGLIGGNSGSLVGKSGSGFDSPFAKQYTISKDSVSFMLKNLLFGETFYYRMRALNNLDTSNWSGAKSMTSYASPSLKSPTNGTTGTDLGQVFSWNEYEGVIDYFFQISENPEFTNPFEGPSDSTSIFFTIQKFGHEYFWRVMTANPFDESDWSDVWSFTTVNTVTLVSPANEALEINVCPKYEWKEIIGAAEYELWIDNNPDFTTATGTMVELPYFQCQTGLQKNTTYYWKVRGYSSIDTTGWSNTWSFTTEGYIGIEEKFSQNSVSIYPNPSEGYFSVSINSNSNADYLVSVIDLTGRIVFKTIETCSVGNNNIAINLSDINKGVYMINIRKEDEDVTKKLFIR